MPRQDWEQCLFITQLLCQVISYNKILSLSKHVKYLGGAGGGGSYYSEVSRYNINDKTWETIGNMKKGRYFHGMTVLSCHQDSSELCQTV